MKSRENNLCKDRMEREEKEAAMPAITAMVTGITGLMSMHLAVIQADTVLLHGTILGQAFTITTGEVIYWGIAALIGLIAESIVGWRLPFGIVGAIAASLLGVWLLTAVIPVTIGGDVTIAGQPIPLIKAALGAIIVVAIWHMLTYPFWRERERGYRRRYRRSYAYRDRDYY
jgi:uncharacterized membrane protein YeaQ/YmgE (transglycosylase-associated protein family)